MRLVMRSALRCGSIARRLPGFWARQRHEAAGMVTGRAPDSERKSGVPWCWDHERPVTQCHKGGDPCRGEVIDRSDPTGDAAVAWDDARRNVTEAHHLAKVLDRSTAKFLELIKVEEIKPPTVAELADLAHANRTFDAALDCHWCAQVPPPGQRVGQWLQPLHRVTTVGDVLAEPHGSCAGHMRRIGSTGAAPTAEDTQAWQDTGHWPGQRTGPKA